MRAPSGVPLVSFGTSEIFGLSKSNSASSAACLIALATFRVEPGAVMGRSSAILTVPGASVTAPPGNARATTATRRTAGGEQDRHHHGGEHELDGAEMLTKSVWKPHGPFLCLAGERISRP